MQTKMSEVEPIHSPPPRLRPFRYSCPELIPAHRNYYYRIEVLLGKKYELFTENEKEIAHLDHELNYCKWCKWQRLVSSAERSKFEEVLKEVNDNLETIGEGFEPFRAERGLAEELYFSEEYDESGESISGQFYGHGSNLAESTRIIFPLLELQDFIENILDDQESDIPRITEKRRYVQGVLECLGEMDHREQYLEKTKESWQYVQRQLFNYMEAAISLGFILAEYKVRFRHEEAVMRGKYILDAREKGLPKARKANLKRGSTSRTAVLNAARDIYDREPYLKTQKSETARRIENMKILALQKADKTFLGFDAIYKHLADGWKNGELT